MAERKNVSLFTVKDYAEKMKRMNIKITPDDIINLCDRSIKINMEFVNRAREKGEVQ